MHYAIVVNADPRDNEHLLLGYRYSVFVHILIVTYTANKQDHPLNLSPLR